VPFADHADRVAAMETWRAFIDQHPATVAAGACVIVGPAKIMFLNYQTKQLINSKAAPDTWEPAALSDLGL
jgi:hypothetical protein